MRGLVCIRFMYIFQFTLAMNLNQIIKVRKKIIFVCNACIAVCNQQRVYSECIMRRVEQKVLPTLLICYDIFLATKHLGSRPTNVGSLPFFFVSVCVY